MIVNILTSAIQENGHRSQGEHISEGVQVSGGEEVIDFMVFALTSKEHNYINESGNEVFVTGFLGRPYWDAQYNSLWRLFRHDVGIDVVKINETVEQKNGFFPQLMTCHRCGEIINGRSYVRLK